MIIFCDGGSRGNPGPAASAFVVTKGKKVIYKSSKFLGVETNNIAEYTAVLLAVDWLVENVINNPKSVVIVNLDSQLIERQLNGFYKVKNEKLKVIYNKIISKISKYNLEINFQWNYRTDNVLADNLVNKQLDMAASTGK